MLGAALGTAENRSSLSARPFEGLLDLGPRGVRQLGRLVARLFEEPAALGLCLAELLGRIAVGIRKQLTRLVARVVEHLRALAFALLAVALDLGFAVLLLAAAPANLFLGLGQLGLGSLLRVGLDGVGVFRGSANQMQGVHADCMTGGLDRLAASTGRLEHAELRLELGRVAAERLEGVAHLLGVVAVPALRQVFEARERRQRGLLSGFLSCHLRLALRPKYAGSIGRSGIGA